MLRSYVRMLQRLETCGQVSRAVGTPARSEITVPDRTGIRQRPEPAACDQVSRPGCPHAPAALGCFARPARSRFHSRII